MRLTNESESPPMNRTLTIRFLALLVVSSVAVTPHCSSTDVSADRVLPVEEWITNQLLLQQGCVDLNAYTGSTGNLISGRFLQSILTGNFVPSRSIIISNATVSGALDLSYAEIHYATSLRNCRFDGLVWFRGSVFLNGLNLGGSNAFTQPVHMEDARIRNNCSLRNATFDDTVFLNGMQIDRNLNLNGSHFKKDLRADELKVGGSLNITTVQFDGGCSLRYGQIANEIIESDPKNLPRAIFSDGINLYGTKVGGDAHFEYARVDGSVVFDGVQTKGKLFLDHAVFTGNISLSGAQIDKDFTLLGADFKGGFNAEGLQVGGYMEISDTRLGGDCSFRYAQITSEIRSSTNSPATFSNLLNLYGIKVGGDAHLEGAVLNGGVDFRNAQINGKLFMNDASVGATKNNPTLNFDNATIRIINFEGFDWPPDTNAVRLNNLSFTSIYAGTNDEDAPGTWAYLKTNLEVNSVYASDFYQELEGFFQREGRTFLADQVHIVHCRKEGVIHFRKNQPDTYLEYVWNVLSDVLLGYGRETERPFVLSVIIVMIGVLVFRKHNMAPRKLEKITFQPHGDKTAGVHLRHMRTERAGYPPYQNLLYSLDVFIPLIDLRMHESWEPKEGRHFVHIWVHIQRILGWILVPLWLAAVSGLVGNGH